ncbi:BrnT family toxin [Candidatus Nitrospira bockiana]
MQRRRAGCRAAKNWDSHQVRAGECEQVFFNRPLVVADDAAHSAEEARYYVLAHTDAGRLLFLVFTIRNDRIRVISARDMSRKERRIYHEETEKDADV